MIDWEITFREIGYDKLYFDKYPKSNKKVYRICDECKLGKWVIFKNSYKLCKSCRRVSDETRQKMSESAKNYWDSHSKDKEARFFYLRGENNPSKRFEVRQKISTSKLGIKLSDEHKINLSLSHQTPEYLEKMSGKSNPAWLGGKTTEKQKFYNSIEYSNWRKSIFERDNYTCQECNIRGGKLNSHHILPYRDNSEFGLNINNGITLCQKCHSKIKWNEYPYTIKYLNIIFNKLVMVINK